MRLTRRSFVSAVLLGSTSVPAVSANWLMGGSAKSGPNGPWDLVPPAEQRTVSINGKPVEVKTALDEPILIPPGATEAHIRLTYDLPEIRNTAYVQAIITPGAARGFSEPDLEPPFHYQFWRPGDDRDLWVTIKIGRPSSRPGDRFRVSFRGQGIAGPVACVVEVAEGAVNALPAHMPRHRPPMILSLPEKPKVTLDMERIQWSDSGYVGNGKTGEPCWRSRLSHGYSNYSANKENGLYVNTDAFPDDAIEPHRLMRGSDGRPFVRLKSARFPNPVPFYETNFPFQASVLQGQRLDEWVHRRGLYQAEIATPSQKGAWSAFWLLGRKAGGKSMWPPEIDCFESFNGAFGTEYNRASTSSAQHVGPHGSNRRMKVTGLHLDLDRLGFEPSIDLNSTPHRYACLIEDDWITHFVDGVETLMYRNMTASELGEKDWGFYPIVNIAVKADPDADYASGEAAELRWYGLEYYDAGWTRDPAATNTFPAVPPRA